jgi:hypothetical protein
VTVLASLRVAPKQRAAIHFHGVDAEDVAAILRRAQDGLP